MTKHSRCPFEIKGEADGSIIHLHFDENKESRLALIRAAFAKFHTNNSHISMKFHLPASVMDGVSSLGDLKSNIFMYQMEIVACEVEYRLFPFLPYQILQFETQDFQRMANETQYKFFTAYYFAQAAASCEFTLKDFESLESWITFVMNMAIRNGAKIPSVDIKGHENETLLRISSDSIAFYPEDYVEYVGEGNDRRNCFGIVTCPLYPENFWRYSENVVIVLSRMKDFTNLSSEQRRKIREKCNSIYLDGGVDIQDILEDKQPSGLWIPDMIKTPQVS